MMGRIEAVESQLRDAPRRWLVTGGAGFIGSHLVTRLLRLGQDVVVLDNLTTGKRENFSEALAEAGAHASQARFLEADIRDRRACDEAVVGVHHVLHEAALGSVPRSIEDPTETHRNNVEGFVTLLEAARAADVRSFIYASSSSVYGDSPSLPKREDVLGSVLSPYAASKLVDEIYAGAWKRTYGMAILGLRYFNVFGPRQDPAGAYAAVIPRWTDEFLRGERPTIFGDGSTSRDFCPVANVVQANLLAAVRACDPDPPTSPVFNVALGGRTTLDELFVGIRRSLTNLGVACGDVEPRYAPFRPGDVAHSLASIDRAVEELGYAPSVTFEEGLEAAARWYLRSRA